MVLEEIRGEVQKLGAEKSLMRWRKRVLAASPFKGHTHTVFMAMVTLADWKGRLKASHVEIAKVAQMDARQVRRELPIIYLSGCVICTEHGSGKRPSYHYISTTVSEDTLVVLATESLVRTNGTKLH